MRDVVITYSDLTGFYFLLLRANDTVVEKRTTNSYHEIGGIVSNWIVNGY